MAYLAYMSKTVSPRYIIPMENLGRKTLVRYSNMQFRLELSNLEVNGKDFLVNFANKVAPALNKENSSSTFNFRNFQLFNPQTMNYIDLNENLLDYERVDIANSEYSAESIKQRKITENITKAISNKFQFELNRYIKQDQIRSIKGVKSICHSSIVDKSDNLVQEKMLFTSFIKNNSEKLKCDLIKRINLTKFNIPDINDVFFINSKTNKTNTDVCTPEHLENMLPIILTNSSSIDKGFYQTFTVLKKLSLLKNSPVEIGIMTNLNSWSFVLFRNQDPKKVEVESDFVISESYNFGISNPTKKQNELFSYFMDITESIVLDKTKFL